MFKLKFEIFFAEFHFLSNISVSLILINGEVFEISKEGITLVCQI